MRISNNNQRFLLNFLSNMVHVGDLGGGSWGGEFLEGRVGSGEGEVEAEVAEEGFST